MKYRALAFDLDGTLLNADEGLSERTARALARAKDAGYTLIIASARWYQLAERVAREVGTDAPIVACSGAHVRRPTDGHDLLDLRLPERFARHLFEICNQHRCIATLAVDERVVVKLEMDGVSPPRNTPEMTFVPQLDPETVGRPRIALVQGTEVNALIEADLIGEWGDEVRFVESISSRGKRMLTLTARGADKGVALAVACGDLNISPDQVVAFGDAENDIEMFRVTGASFAMGQASDHVKQHATAVTAPNAEDGVAVALERLLDLGEAAFA